MAELALLLRLRVRLWTRQWRVGRSMLAILAFAGLVLVAIATALTYTLSNLHLQVDATQSLRLGQLSVLALSALLIAGPLIGFRAQEFLDVTKLFALPVHPLAVFVSTVLGGFLGIMTLFVLPLLVVPPAWRNPGHVLEIVVLTLAFLTMLYATVQCVTLVFLNVLRSRRFRDFAALLAPAIGLSIYAGFQALVLSSTGGGVHPVLYEFLLSADLEVLDRLTPFLPPLWYADAVYGQRAPWPVTALLLAVVVMLSWLGGRLTLQAFHGQVALAREESRTKEERLGVFDRRLSPALGAMHRKERLLQKRDPWMRMLLIQQLGFIALITVGEGFLGRRSAMSQSFPIWLLLYFEAGFLQNQLGLEGSSFRTTMMLPVRGSRILLAKNLVWLRTFVGGNVLMVPSLTILGAWLGKRQVDVPELIVHVTLSVTVLPAIFGTANLVSVFMPLRVPQRSRRALGQDQSQGGGCTTMFLRILFAVIALMPAALCALLLLRPWRRGNTLDTEWAVLWLPLAILASVACWYYGTVAAGAALDARRPKLADYLH